MTASPAYAEVPLTACRTMNQILGYSRSLCFFPPFSPWLSSRLSSRPSSHPSSCLSSRSVPRPKQSEDQQRIQDRTWPLSCSELEVSEGRRSADSPVRCRWHGEGELRSVSCFAFVYQDISLPCQPLGNPQLHPNTATVSISQCWKATWMSPGYITSRGPFSKASISWGGKREKDRSLTSWMAAIATIIQIQ